jgi:hypothetical protein
MNNVQAGQSYYGNYSPYTYYTYSQSNNGKSSSRGRKNAVNGKIKLPWKKTASAKKKDAEQLNS